MKTPIIAYNTKSLPKALTLEEVLEIYHATKILVYEDIKPYIIDKDNLDLDIAIIDYSKYECKV